MFDTWKQILRTGKAPRYCNECKHIKSCRLPLRDIVVDGKHFAEQCCWFTRPWWSPTLAVEALVANADSIAGLFKRNEKEKEEKPVPEPVKPEQPQNNHFLWKPISENTETLVILLPANLTGRVDHVAVEGQGVRQTAHCSAVANGNREHFRFPHPGAWYGKNITVEARLKDGSDKSWVVPNGAERKEY